MDRAFLVSIDRNFIRFTQRTWVLVQEALNTLNFPGPGLWFFLALGKTPRDPCSAARV